MTHKINAYVFSLVALALSANVALFAPLPAYASLTDGLIGYWPMNGGDVTDKVYDRSGQGNNGYFNFFVANSTTSAKTAGKLGQAIKLNGFQTQAVNMGDINAMDGLNTMTVSAWFKSSFSGANFANEIHIMGKSACSGAGGDGPFELVKVGGSNNIRFVVYSGIGFNVSGDSTTNIDDGRWHFLVGKYDGIDVSISIDGVQENSLTSVFTPTNTSQIFSIGGDCAGQGFTPNGSIDEVRVYNRALSAAEVKQLYNYGQTLKKPPNNLGLVGYWQFSEGTSTAATDFSGYRNTGTLFGSTLPIWTTGKFGKSLLFDGSTSYVNVGLSQSLNLPSAVTISAWIKPTNTSCVSYCDIVANYDSGGGTAQYEFTIRNQTLWFDVGNSGYGNDTGTQMLVPNQWYHVVVTRDAANTATKFYIDGVADAVTRDQTIAPPTSGFGNTAIGRAGDFNGQYFAGTIDEVRIYNRELSATEVAKLYQTRSAAKLGVSSVNLSNGGSLRNGLVGHWTFDGADVSDKVYDRSGQGNNGYFVGSATSSAKTLGKLGQALMFDNLSHITMGTPSSLALTHVGSLAAWFKYSNATDFRGIVGNINWASDSNGYMLGTNTSGNVSLELGDGTSFTIVNSVQSFADNQWHHAVGTWDGTTMTVYIDGAFNNSTPQNRDAVSGVNPVKIGTDPALAQSRFLGKLDDVRIYNRQLSATEVQKLYHLGEAKIK